MFVTSIIDGVFSSNLINEATEGDSGSDGEQGFFAFTPPF